MPAWFLVLMSTLTFGTGVVLLFEPEPHNAAGQVVVLFFRILGFFLMLRGMRMFENLPLLIRVWRTPPKNKEATKPAGRESMKHGIRSDRQHMEIDPLIRTAWLYYRERYARDTSLPVSGTLNSMAAWGLALFLCAFGVAAWYTSIWDQVAFHVMIGTPIFVSFVVVAALLQLLEIASSRWMRRAYGRGKLRREEAIEEAAARVQMSPIDLYRFVKDRCSVDFDRPWKAAFFVSSVGKVYWTFLLLPLARYGVPLAAPGTADWKQGAILAAISLFGVGMYLGVRHVLYKNHDPENYPYPCWYFPLRMLCADIRKAYAL